MDLEKQIRAARKKSIESITAQTFHGELVKNSFSTPVRLECSDDNVYAVKSGHFERALFNEQVAAHLGRMLRAPIPDVALVDVPQELIDANNEKMNHFVCGVGHGSKIVDNCTDKSGITHIDDGKNRAKFAVLAVFFGWFGGGDQQYIYEKSPPHSVYSVDHGHFFSWRPELDRRGASSSRRRCSVCANHEFVQF